VFPGWVAYATTAVLGAVGENKLMPPPDCPCVVINAENGYSRDNSSWILGRMVRDFERWLEYAEHPDPGRKPIRDALNKTIDEAWKRKEREGKEGAKPEGAPKDARPTGTIMSTTRPKRVGLCISVYQADKAIPGFSGRDWLYCSGIIAGAVQLGLAAIPIGLYRDWGVIIITAGGILLSLATGALPQWRDEKWACRTLTKEKTVILTRGNGSQHAIVIIGRPGSLNLEDLASGPASVDNTTTISTKVFMIILWIFWIVLLISAAGLQQHTWFLLLIGGLGIIQNLIVAGSSRRPEDFGIPLKFQQVFVDAKVSSALCAVEQVYPRVGRSMVATFFNAGLRPHEEKEMSLIEENHAVELAQ
jgi:hypothetical protein